MLVELREGRKIEKESDYEALLTGSAYAGLCTYVR